MIASAIKITYLDGKKETRACKEFDTYNGILKLINYVYYYEPSEHRCKKRGCWITHYNECIRDRTEVHIPLSAIREYSICEDALTKQQEGGK